METRVRKQIERASRVMIFCRERPSDLPGYDLAVTRLRELLSRAASLAQEHLTSSLATREAVAERNALRGRSYVGLLMLARIARMAGIEVLGTPIVVRLPGPRQSLKAFLTGARAAISTGREREELLVKYGFPPGQLDILEQEIDALEAFNTRRDEFSQGKVIAREALSTATREMVMVVRQLHAINAFRFRDDPAELRGWAHASDIRVGSRKAATEEAEIIAPMLPPGPAGLIAPA